MKREGTSTRQRLLILGQVHLAYVALFVLVLVPLAVWLVAGDRLYSEYVLEVKAPVLRQRFGFETERVRIGSLSGGYEVEAISRVTPGGIFEKAGFRAGDVPTGYVDTGRAAFYYQLQAVGDGVEVTVRVTTVPALQEGSAKERRIRIGPSSAGHR